jgi:hypothetical protein
MHDPDAVVKRLSLPVWLEAPLAVALLDYTLYWTSPRTVDTQLRV